MASDNPVVKDLIIPLESYPHLNESQTLHDADQIIQSYSCEENDRLIYAVLLVLNEQNQLIGRLTLKDMLQNLDPRLKEASRVRQFEGKEMDDPDLAILWEDSFFVECTKRSHLLVKEIMSPITHILKGSDPVLKALSIMLSTKEVVLPVVDEGRVMGVIRLKEIFKAISNRCKI